MPCKRRGGGITPAEETYLSFVMGVPLAALFSVAAYIFVTKVIPQLFG